jgi:DNA-binding transcriptional ArsR family regulator
MAQGRPPSRAVGPCRAATFPGSAMLGLTDGNLGRHLEVLAGAGLITLVKGFQARRPRTWAAISPLGRSALANELRQMRALLDSLDGHA